MNDEAARQGRPDVIPNRSARGYRQAIFDVLLDARADLPDDAFLVITDSLMSWLRDEAAKIMIDRLGPPRRPA